MCHALTELITSGKGRGNRIDGIDLRRARDLRVSAVRRTADSIRALECVMTRSGMVCEPCGGVREWKGMEWSSFKTAFPRKPASADARQRRQPDRLLRRRGRSRVRQSVDGAPVAPVPCGASWRAASRVRSREQVMGWRRSKAPGALSVSCPCSAPCKGKRPLPVGVMAFG